MKLFIKYCIIALAWVLTSCEKEPIQYPTLNPEKVVLKVGEKTSVELVKNDYRLHHVRIIAVYPIDNKPAETFLCEISDINDLSFNLKAQHIGVDTLVIEYHYTTGTFAYGEDCILPIRVEE